MTSAGLLKAGAEFRLRAKESRGYQPWEDLEKECSGLREHSAKARGRSSLSPLKEQQEAHVAGPEWGG